MVAEVLNIQPGDRILDMCSAPGGKSLSIAQRLFANDTSGHLTCNEFSNERRRRLLSNLKDHLPHSLFDQQCIQVTGHDGTTWYRSGMDGYDKVVVDAPCSSERHLLHDTNEWTQWSSTRTNTMAKKQVDLLLEATKAVRPGGIVVYATCSLSQTENDGVVTKAIRKSRVKFRLVSSKWRKWGEKTDKSRWPIGEATQCGWLILPDSQRDCDDESRKYWGPLYLALLQREEDQ